MSNEWISVETELPGPRMVILAFDNGGVWFGMYLRGRWIEEDEGGGFVEDKEYSVTHWQPLPSPPDTEEK